MKLKITAVAATAETPGMGRSGALQRINTFPGYNAEAHTLTAASIEDLYFLSMRSGCPVILNFDKYGNPQIVLYDDYME